MNSWLATGESNFPEKGSLYVWRISLLAKDEYLGQLYQLLSEEEQRRVERFRFVRHRRRFTVARTSLRTILARILGCRPEEVRFVYNQWGKPDLAQSCNHLKLKFNISRSHEIALLVISRDREVGIDIEWLLQHPGDFDTLAKRFFAPEEYKQLRLLPESERLEGFFRFWTRKEALVKAVGTGLTIPLKQIIVNLNDQPIRLHRNQREQLGWYLYHLVPCSGYIGTVASHGPSCTLHIQEWMAENSE